MRKHRLAIVMLASRIASRTVAGLRAVVAVAMASRKRAGVMVCLVVAIATMSHVDASTQWSSTGSMITGRLYHAATLLADGRVLVTGGLTENYFTGHSAEIYDPEVGTWSPTGSMAIWRTLHSSTLLRDGRVLVTGGGSPTAEIYDPAAGTWSATAPSRTDVHTATLLPNGRVLVIGGAGTDTAEIYDPAAGTWSLTGSTTTERNRHTATLLPDGRVLVIGGCGTDTAEIYDPDAGTWSLTGSMSTERYGHTATLLPNGRVLVSGGRGLFSGTPDNLMGTAEIYDPASGTWSTTGSMSAPRDQHQAALLPDNRVLVTGGSGWSLDNCGLGPCDDGWFPFYTAEVYDPAVGTWSYAGRMSTWRTAHSATALRDGRVLVAGGWSPFHVVTADLYSHDGTPLDEFGPQLSCAESDRVWHNDDVALACTATDFGSGLANAADASFVLSTTVPIGVETAIAATGGRSVCDLADNCTTAGPLNGNKVDKKAPAASCNGADGAWHNGDVIIACLATDLGSGLVNTADASFVLNTDVAVGTETASAATNSRQVCDTVGNCSTAGAVGTNKVDKKAPTITIASPSATATYAMNAKVGASYACMDGGSGMTSCAGPVANGSLFNTSSIGTKTFVVTASDAVGNSSALTVTYTVVARGKK